MDAEQMKEDHDLLIEIKTILLGLKNDYTLTNTDHETRIRSLERAKWIAAGLAAAGGGVLGTVAKGIIQAGH